MWRAVSFRSEGSKNIITRMWMLDEESVIVESDGAGEFSSEDEGDIQSAILEMQREEANQRLRELEEASSQLLREIDMLEIQFQIERSCRESAEALAVKMSKENRVLKRASRALMPLIPELSEDPAALTSDTETEPAVNCETLNGSEESGDDDEQLLESQAKIAELQTIVDGLLTDKLLLEQQIENLTKEGVELRQQLVLQVEEKEAIMTEMNKQSRNMSKIKRVSQLVTQEFTEMSQELELQRGLRQHAEDVAHQLMHKATQEQGSDVDLELRRALEQVSIIGTALRDIQRHYQDQGTPSRRGRDENGVLSEVQSLKDQLETCEEQREDLERQLAQANMAVTQLQGEVRELQDKVNEGDKDDEPGNRSVPLPPPPPPPPPATTVTNSVPVLRKKARKAEPHNPSAPDTRANAVEEMMERIKKSIILKPVCRKQDDDSSWTDQGGENRKSAIMELKGMLDKMEHQPLRREATRRGTVWNVEEAELLRVLRRRRRVMEDNWEPNALTEGSELEPVGSLARAGESSSTPVLRRLRQNREKRNSRLRASALIISQAD
ncbi:shootin-1 isoform X2 [Takifugu rubripes]|uniref:shootin-1 isoform X2 n=1 Tax=Takifugu rubripes TaxID=31033 RepID=UPI0011460EA4|nr:shootin-1-like isoform X2 [Takifugu rubripes]